MIIGEIVLALGIIALVVYLTARAAPGLTRFIGKRVDEVLSSLNTASSMIDKRLDEEVADKEEKK